MTALQVAVLIHKASKLYISKDNETVFEIIYAVIKTMILFSIPILNIAFLVFNMCQNEDKVISETAKKANWELKNQDKNGFTM